MEIKKTQEEIDLEITKEFLKEYEMLMKKYRRHFTPVVNLGVAKMPEPQEESLQISGEPKK
jgi:hypothetical protein